MFIIGISLLCIIYNYVSWNLTIITKFTILKKFLLPKDDKDAIVEFNEQETLPVTLPELILTTLP